MQRRRRETFTLGLILILSALGGCTAEMSGARTQAIKTNARWAFAEASPMSLAAPLNDSALASLPIYTRTGDTPTLRVASGGEDDKVGGFPLKHTAVYAELSGGAARVEVAQIFENTQDTTVEVVYTFPLPENSAVDDMELRVADRVVKAEIQRRDEARRTYEDARRRGNTAALLEQERPNVFTQSVANIPPGEQVEVVVRYIQSLTVDGVSTEFVFPMVVGPRFTPGNATPSAEGGTGWGQSTDRVPDAARVTPPYYGKGARPGHDISIEALIDPGFPITDLQVPTHAVHAVESDGRVLVTLEAHDRLPNRDFVMRYDTAGDEPAVAVQTHRAPDSDDRGYFALTVRPPEVDLEEAVGRREIVFVVDTSGSMNGAPLALCKAAMFDAIDRLRPMDTFNIITFAGGEKLLFPASRPANTTNLASARDFIDGARAGGGTLMARAVQAALAPSGDPGRHRYVFFMTDGYISNEREIFSGAQTLVDRMKSRGQRARVFGYGTGSSVNRHLIEGLSTAGEGIAFYATLREDPTRGVDRFFRLIDKAVLTQVEIDWGGLPMGELTPGPIPDLFASRPLVLHGRYTVQGDAPLEGTITVRGILDGERISIPVEIALPVKAPERAGLASLWARSRIADLTEDLWHGHASDTVERITRLALSHRLVTPYTSFVAVDRARVVGGASKTVVQPSAPPEGVNMAQAAPATAAAMPAAPPPPMMPVTAKVAEQPAPKPAPKRVAPPPRPRRAPVARSAASPAPKARRSKRRSRRTTRAAARPSEVDDLLGGVSSSSARTRGSSRSSAASRKLTRAQILSVVRAAASAFHACGQKASGPIEQLVTLMLSIGADGEVKSAKITNPQTLAGEEAARECTLKAARALRFPKSTGEPLRVSVPVKL